MTYVDILQKEGPLSTKELAKEASNKHTFNSMDIVAIEKDALRFAHRYEALGILIRKSGKLNWLPSPTPTSSQHKADNTRVILNKGAFLTSRAAVKCEHCGLTIDLTKVQIKWRLKSRILQRVLHVYHFIRVTCPSCGWTGRYDTGREVKPLLLEPLSNA